jgi:hypothetical protein
MSGVLPSPSWLSLSASPPASHRQWRSSFPGDWEQRCSQCDGGLPRHPSKGQISSRIREAIMQAARSPKPITKIISISVSPCSDMLTVVAFAPIVNNKMRVKRQARRAAAKTAETRNNNTASGIEAKATGKANTNVKDMMAARKFFIAREAPHRLCENEEHNALLLSSSLS